MNCALTVLTSDKECYISLTPGTSGFAHVCRPNKEYVPECLKSQHRPISSQTNENIKDVHFNTDKHTAHVEHFFFRALFYRICTTS